MSNLNPNRQKFLARLGRKYTMQALGRMGPERRYPILLSFLKQTLIELTDVVPMDDAKDVPESVQALDEQIRRRIPEIDLTDLLLSLAPHWGDGTLSSSDGQRFPVRGKVRNASALPRYFGYGEGITFYSWSSDQLSQYGTKVISSTIRDATYVLTHLWPIRLEMAHGLLTIRQIGHRFFTAIIVA